MYIAAQEQIDKYGDKSFEGFLEKFQLKVAHESIVEMVLRFRNEANILQINGFMNSIDTKSPILLGLIREQASSKHDQ